MIQSENIVAAAPSYLGTPYSRMDCQAFVERCLADAGLRKDLPGSNAWYRLCREEGWTGTPEECRELFGFIPPGAFLFILKQDGGEPGKYRGDGIGNASHIGLYTGTGQGAIHSSSSRGAVCESTFKGKSIRGGWNRVGLWRKIDYGETVNRILTGGGQEQMEYQAQVTGGALNLREQPSKGSNKLCQIPDGTILTVTDEALEWAKTSYSGRDGWVMKTYLEPVQDPQPDPDAITVSRKQLEQIYDTLGDMLGLRG